MFLNALKADYQKAIEREKRLEREEIEAGKIVAGF